MQAMWFKHAADNNSGHFDRTMNEALNEVVAALEKRSVYKVFSKHISTDSLHTKFEIRLDKYDSNEVKINLQDTIMHLIPPADTLQYVHHNSRHFLIRDSENKIKLAERVDSILGEILTELKMDTLPQSVPYPSAGIDTLIENALRQKGIRIGFDYAVTDMNRNIIYKSAAFDTTERGAIYRVKLTPAHIQFKSGELLVQIHKRTEMIIHSLGYFIVILLAFTIIIIITFSVSIRTILRQKKISVIKNDFINNMTHEFKTPLATISIAADAMKEGGRQHEQVRHFAEVIKQESKNMNQKVETILQMALLEKHQLDLNLHPEDMHEIINGALKHMALHFEKSGAKIETALQATQTHVLADKHHLCNVIANVLDNAVKYSQGEPHIIIKTCNEENKLDISISDYGIGMSKDEQKKVFDKFYRAQSGNIHNTKGFGLGLSYSKEIIEMHKGCITLSSEKGVGTTVKILLPLL